MAAAPFTQPSETDVSPRVRSTFREVRRRILPAIIERQYTEARAAFDRKDGSAADRFTQVLKMIADADLQSIANEPRLSQLRAVATDFLVLSTPKASPPLQSRAAQPPAEKPLMAPPAPRDTARRVATRQLTTIITVYWLFDGCTCPARHALDVLGLGR